MAVTPSGTPQSGGSFSAASSFTAILASGASVGHLDLIACTTQATGVTTGTPTGWTLGTSCHDNSGTDTRVFWRVRQPGDPSTVPFSMSGGSSVYGWVTAAYSGTSTSNPFGTPTLTSMTSSAAAVPVAALTTTTAGSYEVAVAGIGSGSTTYNTMPTGLTQVIATPYKATIIAAAAVTTPSTISASTFGLSASERGASSHFEILMAAAANLPIANAGPVQSAEPWTKTTLTAGNSVAGTYPISSYAWTQHSGTIVSLSSTSAVSPTFTAPGLSAGDSLVFGVVVTDSNGGSSAESSVTITALPATEFMQSHGAWVPLQTTVM
jgi:hypothetical protein